MNKYTKSINIKLTDTQFNDLKKLKKLSGLTMSKLIRNQLPFLLMFYKKK